MARYDRSLGDAVKSQFLGLSMPSTSQISSVQAKGGANASTLPPALSSTSTSTQTAAPSRLTPGPVASSPQVLWTTYLIQQCALVTGWTVTLTQLEKDCATVNTSARTPHEVKPLFRHLKHTFRTLNDHFGRLVKALEGLHDAARPGQKVTPAQLDDLGIKLLDIVEMKYSEALAAENRPTPHDQDADAQRIREQAEADERKKATAAAADAAAAAAAAADAAEKEKKNIIYIGEVAWDSSKPVAAQVNADNAVYFFKEALYAAATIGSLPAQYLGHKAPPMRRFAWFATQGLVFKFVFGKKTWRLENELLTALYHQADLLNKLWKTTLIEQKSKDSTLNQVSAIYHWLYSLWLAHSPLHHAKGQDHSARFQMQGSFLKGVETFVSKVTARDLGVLIGRTYGWFDKTPAKLGAKCPKTHLTAEQRAILVEELTKLWNTHVKAAISARDLGHKP